MRSALYLTVCSATRLRRFRALASAALRASNAPDWALRLRIFVATASSTSPSTFRVTRSAFLSLLGGSASIFERTADNEPRRGLREQLCANKKITLLGQSFGGFCILSYLSYAPEAIERALFTCGLAPVGQSADAVYTATYTAVLRPCTRIQAGSQSVSATLLRLRKTCGALEKLLSLAW